MSKNCLSGLLVFFHLLCVLSAAAQGLSISVGPDQVLTYPANMTVLPDEHTTFVPPPPGSGVYTVFAASNIAPGVAGTVVLQTFDMRTFTQASGYTNPVMSPPVSFAKCNPTYDTEFDENYSGQGSVLQDPTLPPGNLIMIYEAENHCPGGVNQQPFYATVGVARSSDNGVTWPTPENGPLGGPNRYAVLRLAAPEPASEPSPSAMGNATPAAFIDKSNYVYVTYVAPPGPGLQGDGKLRVARAPLGAAGQLQFLKWYNGSFSQPGIGGLDNGFLPAGGCIGYQVNGEIYYVDPLGLYLMVFVCGSGLANPPHAAWYFSTATSLDLQDWTVPQMIANSQFPLYNPCPNSAAQGASFDGWYPSLVSPGSPVGHLSLGGYVFFLNGCNVSTDRAFNTRTFTITGPPIAPNYEGLWWAAPAGSESGWGVNFAHQGDTIFASWFTYDLTGKGLWVVMTAPKTAPGIYSGTLYTTTGPAFSTVPFNPAEVSATAVGAGTLTFTGNSSATFAYTVNGIAQVKNITREIFGPQPTCVFAGGDLAGAVNYQDLWWAAPAGAESGWGVNLTHEGDTIFASWFTYDTDHSPLWLVVTAAKIAPGVYSGTLYRTIGPPFNAVPFNPAGVTPTSVGAATFNFTNGNAGTFSYTVNGVSQVKPITREVFTAPGTICL